MDNKFTRPHILIWNSYFGLAAKRRIIMSSLCGRDWQFTAWRDSETKDPIYRSSLCHTKITNKPPIKLARNWIIVVVARTSIYTNAFHMSFFIHPCNVLFLHHDRSSSSYHGFIQFHVLFFDNYLYWYEVFF